MGRARGREKDASVYPPPPWVRGGAMDLNFPVLPGYACKSPSTNKIAIGQEVGGTGLSDMWGGLCVKLAGVWRASGGWNETSEQEGSELKTYLKVPILKKCILKSLLKRVWNPYD